MKALGTLSIPIESVEQIDSTNDELMRRAAAGRYEQICLVARTQAAGRARQGRVWFSEPGALICSLALVLRPKEWLGLSLVAGLSLAQSLHPRIMVKWPNDLLLDGRKLAGILIETTPVREQETQYRQARYAVIGIGMNMQAPQNVQLRTPAAGLAELMDGAHPQAVLAQALNPLVRSIKKFETYGFEAFQDEFNARDALKSRSIALTNGVQGIAWGTDRKGALLVKDPQSGSVARVISHEVSRICG